MNTLELTDAELWLLKEIVDVLAFSYGPTVEKKEFFHESCNMNPKEADKKMGELYTKMVEAGKLP